MEEHSQYLVVVVPDEVLGFPNSPSLAIPTFGAATTPIEQYRTVAVASTNLPDLGVAFTDGNAVAAISLVAEGGLTDVMQLEAAETALQALLLHNIVHVLGPEDFHLRALPEPYVNLSIHTAPIVRPLP